MRLFAGMVCGVLLAVASSASAQNTPKILTPNDDECSSFTAAMDSGQPQSTLAAMAGWALGFLSGVAEGSGRDILREITASDVMHRMYADCKRQPNRLMSEILEEMGAALIAAHH